MQLYVVIEHGAFRVGVVFAPVGAEPVLAVNELSATEEVSRIVEAVVVKAVGVERLPAVAEHDILTRLHHLPHTVIPRVVAGQRQRVTLPVAHMTEGAEGVGGLEVVGAVAHQRGTLVAEHHLTLGNLRLGVGTIHIVLQHIGVDKIDAVVHDPTVPALRSSNGTQQAKDKQA